METNSSPSQQPSWRNSIMWKIAIIAGLILGLLIPLSMISGVIEERQKRKDVVTGEIANTWGSSQLVIGPLLVLPYKVISYVDSGQKEKQRIVTTEIAYLLPKHYDVKDQLKTETRYRSIFKSIVYTSKLTAQGEFNLADIKELKISDDAILWDDACLLISLPEAKSIQEAPMLQWNKKSIEMLPGTHGVRDFNTGLYAPIQITADSGTVPFSLGLTLKGSNSFSLVPIGKQSALQLSSDWSSPSFVGNILPTTRNVTKSGFEATWNIPYFARKYSQTFTSRSFDVSEQLKDSQVGVSLISPIDFYRESQRAVKYAILFLVLTFATYFFFEVLGNLRLHPFQYLLIGCALCLFYLLLIAFSEVVGFNWAYLIASIPVIGSIALYSRAIASKLNKHLQWVIAGLLTGLYAYLYVLLQLEDMSLLFGTIGLFVVLALIMYITRNIDWYKEQLA
jgi:inner membrane protein